MLSETKKKRIIELYGLFKKTGQNEFPFNDNSISDGLNIYFGKPPAYMLFSIDNIVETIIYVGKDAVVDANKC